MFHLKVESNAWSLVVKINLILSLNRRNLDQWYYIDENENGLSLKKIICEVIGTSK